jgi:PAS domain S-box-containing protein
LLLNSRAIRTLFEAAEQVGIQRDELVGPLGIDAAHLAAPRSRMEWSTFVSVCDRLSEMVGGDADRLRDLGRRINRVPSQEVARRVGRGIFSVRTMYQMLMQWLMPVMFPHLVSRVRRIGSSRVAIHCEIPESYAACAAFLQISVAACIHLPEVVGLPPSVVVEERVTSRTFDLLLEVPRSRSLGERLSHVARALGSAGVSRRELVAQGAELTASIVALQRARDELFSVLDNLPDLVIVHDRGTVLWANRLLIETLGYHRLDDVVGKSVVDVVAPRSRSIVAERMSTPVASPRAPALTEAVLVTRTGEEVVVEMAPAQSVVFNSVPALLVALRDVNARVRMQQKLMLADRLASIGLLAAGVAHEVNNPLGYVLNNIELARKELTKLGPGAEATGGVLSIALEGVDRIRVIVRDLLMLSRGDEDRHVPTDLHAIVESTLDLAAPEIARTARLVRDFVPTPLVCANDARIAQVLLNLVANGLDAMRGRPRDQNELRVRIATAADGRVLLEVTDTGHGIADADISHIFEPFFTTRASGDGTGLGLSIAQTLVVSLGGEIQVESSAGRGATFRVLLPAAGGPAAAAGAAAETSPS